MARKTITAAVIDEFLDDLLQRRPDMPEKEIWNSIYYFVVARQVKTVPVEAIDRAMNRISRLSRDRR